jgi:hypothetical protein
MTELDSEMSDAQRAFVQAVDALGAKSSDTAQPLAELPRLSTRELLALEKSDLIREAGDGKVYLFRTPPTDAAPGVAAASGPGFAIPVPVRLVRRIVVVSVVLVILLLVFLLVR